LKLCQDGQTPGKFTDSAVTNHLPTQPARKAQASAKGGGPKRAYTPRSQRMKTT
jgi:hypothetical protein